MTFLVSRSYLMKAVYNRYLQNNGKIVAKQSGKVRLNIRTEKIQKDRGYKRHWSQLLETLYQRYNYRLVKTRYSVATL